MTLLERQTRGVLAFLLILAGISLAFFHYSQSPVAPPEFADQTSTSLVFEIIGHPNANGVYFLPAHLKPDTPLPLVIHHGFLSDHPLPDRHVTYSYAMSGQNSEKVALRSKTRLALGLPLNLNAATHEELVLISGIGPVLAQRIVDLRAQIGGFRQLEDLMAIRGIKEKTLAKIGVHLEIEVNP